MGKSFSKLDGNSEGNNREGNLDKKQKRTRGLSKHTSLNLGNYRYELDYLKPIKAIDPNKKNELSKEIEVRKDKVIADYNKIAEYLSAPESEQVKGIKIAALRKFALVTYDAIDSARKHEENNSSEARYGLDATNTIFKQAYEKLPYIRALFEE